MEENVSYYSSLVNRFDPFLADEPNNQSFGYGKRFIDLQVGYGDGWLVRYLAVSPQFGVGVSDLLGENAWYKGNFDVVLQGAFIKNFRPSSGFSAEFRPA